MQWNMRQYQHMFRPTNHSPIAATLGLLRPPFSDDPIQQWPSTTIAVTVVTLMWWWRSSKKSRLWRFCLFVSEKLPRAERRSNLHCSISASDRFGYGTRRGLAMMMIAWPAPSHYLKQCWNIVNWTLGNKLQWNFNRNLHIFIQENAFEIVVRNLAAILSRSQCVKYVVEMSPP